MKSSGVEVAREKDPFTLWEEGMSSDSAGLYHLSASKFQLAAQTFFEFASSASENKIVKAYYEYSTLMDAFSRIQRGRELLELKEFDYALEKFTESSNILRATVHFGFLAPYVSACAISEVTDLRDQNDKENDDSFEHFKHAIALFEQSKIALSFRDENDPIVKKIDTYIQYCISEALRLEATRDKGTVDSEPSFNYDKDLNVSRNQDIGTKTKMQYLPLMDFKRAKEGSFVVSYPDLEGLWLINIGVNSANLLRVGSLCLNRVILESKSSLHFSANEFGKGRIRLQYEDNVTGMKFDEGCLHVI
jgi:tetratricopeptide (TPR) repeat protein